jgi:hypothetical protein
MVFHRLTELAVVDCVPDSLPPSVTGEVKQLAGTMDKMKNMAVKRDSMRKSFIGDATAAKTMAPVPDHEEDVSSYL